MKIKFITTILCLSVSILTFGQQLFGHVNSQDILAAMPEAGTAQLALQAELEGLQEQGQIMMQEFEAQQKEFQINQESMNDKMGFNRTEWEDQLIADFTELKLKVHAMKIELNFATEEDKEDYLRSKAKADLAISKHKNTLHTKTTRKRKR